MLDWSNGCQSSYQNEQFEKNCEANLNFSIYMQKLDTNVFQITVT